MSPVLRKHLLNFGGALLIVGSAFGALEVLLRVTDPWGIYYFQDLAVMANERFIYSEARGYVILDGTHRFSHWTATLRDGARYTPDNAPSGICRVAILGDSVAFGYGVNDADVWVNRLAVALPDAQFINYGIPRYNSTNALKTYRAVPPADLYVYVVVNNDVEGALDPRTQRFVGGGESLPFLVRYANFAVKRGDNTDYAPPAPNNTEELDRSIETVQRFLSEVAMLAEEPKMRFVSFSNELVANTLIAEGYDVATVRYPHEYRISLADYHLNADGNRALADALQPTFADWINGACASVAYAPTTFTP